VNRCHSLLPALASTLLLMLPALASAAPHQRSAKLARSCPGASLTPNAHNVRLVKAATLCLINRERARDGERPLRANAHLMRAARAHSQEMVARDYFSHVSPSGKTPLERILASGFIARRVGWCIGENIAWGSMWLATPRAIVQAWMTSPGHRANILDRAYRFTGIGIDPELPHSMSGGQSGAMYTQDFGAILAG
jgi:uncharacterized protein YkwD